MDADVFIVWGLPDEVPALSSKNIGQDGKGIQPVERLGNHV